MERPNRKEYINKKTKNQLIADLELHIDYLENTYITSVEEKMYSESKMLDLMDDYQDYLFKTNQPVLTMRDWIKENL